MAVLSRVSFYPNERLDTPDMRAIEAYSLNDWRYFIQGMMSDRSMIFAGFEITNYANIFSVQGVKISQSNIALIHPEATTQASGFYVSSGSERDFNLTLNPGVNFVEFDLASISGTPDVRSFWDPSANSGAGGEYSQTIDTVVNLQTNIIVNVSGFTAGRIPLYKFTVSNSGLVTEVQDCREMYHRLGSGGSSPNADNNFLISGFENPSKATASSPGNPFSGGDKEIHTEKAWKDAVMTFIKKSSAKSYWYQEAQSVPETYQNSALTLLIGGTWKHEGFTSTISAITNNSVTVAVNSYFPVGTAFKVGTTTYTYSAYTQATGVFSGVSPTPTSNLVGETLQAPPGGIAPGKLSLYGGSTVLRMGKQNNCSLNPFIALDLATKPILFIVLPLDSAITYRMGQDAATPVFPQHTSSSQNSITTSTIQVIQGGNYISAGGNILVRNVAFSYTGYDPVTGVFTGVSPDPSGLVKSNDLVYQAANTTNGYYHYGVSAQVPSTQDGVSRGAEKTLWLAYYDGSTVHTQNTVLSAGETVQIGNNTSAAIIAYIGSQGEADSNPIFGVNSISDGTNLTKAIQAAFKIIETPIYDEVLVDMSGNGWASGTTVTLPPNTRAANAPGVYTISTGELEIYENGILLRVGYDYNELTSNQVSLSRDVYANSYLRFRIATIGGAGAAAGGGSAGQTLQGSYANGSTILTSSGNPVVIDGPAGQKLLHVKGNVQIDGVLDPTGIQLTPVTANPFAANQMGIYVDSNSNHLSYTRADGSTLKVGAIVESLGGEAQNFKRSMTNMTGATIPAGSAVYISDAGQISLASAAMSDTSRFFGITETSIANTSTGKVIYLGVVPGILTGMGLNSGTFVWLSDSPGLLSAYPAGGATSFETIVGLVDGNDLILQPHTTAALR